MPCAEFTDKCHSQYDKFEFQELFFDVESKFLIHFICFFASTVWISLLLLTMMEEEERGKKEKG